MSKALTRIWSLSINDFIHLVNDWWLPAFMLIGGTMELLLIGWATSRPITNLPLLVLDYDRSQTSRNYLTALENTGTFRFDGYVSDMTEIETKLDRGQIYAAVVFPPDFGAELASPSGIPTIQILLNGAESSPSVEALRAVEGVTRDFGERIVLERSGISSGDLTGFVPSLRMWFNEELSEAYYTTPAELALMLEFTILLFAALTFSRERELGTLEQLLVMPFSSMEIIAGKALPVVLIGFVDFLLMLGVVHFAFGVPVRGSLGLLMVLALVYILVELGKGMVVSVVSRTQHQAFLIVMLIGMVDFMFTGYAVPVESMPVYMRYLANIVPSHHWLAIVRGLLLKGAGLEILWPNVLALLVLGLVIGIFSLQFIRRVLNWE
jgi:ABC-2 type transport system permease protein